MNEKRLSAKDRQPFTAVLDSVWVAMQARACQPDTIKDYRDKVDLHVRWFADTYGREMVVADFTLGTAQAYIAARLIGSWGRGPVAPSSAAGDVRVLKAISTRLFEAGQTGAPRMAGLKQPIIRPTDVKPRAVSTGTLGKLLKANATLPRTAARNEAILAVLFDVGPRVSELVAIDREDVFLDQGYIAVRSPGKGGPTRSVPLGKATTRALRAHLGRHKGTGPLLLGERNERMTPGAVRQVLARLSEKARVPRVFPHAFRHEASAWYTALGAPASAKNAVFGWKPGPSDMEAGYTVLTTAQVVRQHQDRSPLDHFHQVVERQRLAA